LVLRGARQVGKSTLVREFAKSAGLELLEVNLERHPVLDTVFRSLDVGRISREIEGLGFAELAGFSGHGEGGFEVFLGDKFAEVVERYPFRRLPLPVWLFDAPRFGKIV